MPDWPEIVRLHSPVLWKTAYRLLGDHADAADCLQEAFASALEVGRRGVVTSWPALLHTMVTRRAIDRLRERLRQSKHQQEEPVDWTAVPCANPGPAQSAEDRELAAQLRRSLAQLPPQQAEVLCLVCLDGLSHEEAAQQAGTTVGNVGVLVHRARARLRGLLTTVIARRER